MSDAHYILTESESRAGVTRADSNVEVAKPFQFGLCSPFGVAYTLVVFLILLFFLTFMLPVSNSAPYSDDWIYIGAARMEPRSAVLWFLQPHNEHFIPLIKLGQYAALRIADFDFRPLIGLNAIVAAVGSLAAFGVAHSYRGRNSFADLFFPLILMNCVFNVFAWGFSAQFGIPVALTFVFLVLFYAALGRESLALLGMAFLALLIFGVCGLNGGVVAFIVSSMLLAISAISAKGNMRKAVLWLAGMTFVVLVAVHIRFYISAVQITEFIGAGQLASWFYMLLRSSLAVRAEPRGFWGAAAIGMLLLGGIIVVLSNALSVAKNRSLQLADAAVHAMLLGYLVLMLVVTLGRAGLSPWASGLELHYGYLTAPIPILAWIVLSRALPRLPAQVCGLALLLLFADAFWAGSSWRFGYLQSKKSYYIDLARLLRSDAPAEDITRQYMKDIYWQDTPELRRSLEAAIESYRVVLRR